MVAVVVDDEDKPDVDDGGEVKESPNPDDVDGVTPLNKVAAKSTNPKAKLTDEEKLEKSARDLMISQINRAIAELSDDIIDLEEATLEEIDEFIKAMMVVISAILIENGEAGYATGVELAGLTIDDVQGFTFTTEADDAYKSYLRRVGQSYSNDTAESIRKALVESNDLGLNRKATEERIRNIVDTDDYRIKRLARTELNNSQNIGKLEGMKSLSAETGATWEKTIKHTAGGICPLCASQEGRWTALSQPLWAEGEAISTVNDKGDSVIYINDWQNNEANDYHPNGRGTLIFRRVV